MNDLKIFARCGMRHKKFLLLNNNRLAFFIAKLTYIVTIALFFSCISTLTYSQKSHLLQKEDAKINWQSIGPPGGRVFSMMINHEMPEIVNASTEDGFFFKSTDGGITSELVEYDLIPPLVSPLDSNLMFKGSSISTDGGKSWFKMEVTVSFITFHPYDANIIYALNGNPTLKNFIVSFDKGLNWDTINSFNETVSWLRYITINENIFLFLSSSTKIYKSTDGGLNWNAILYASSGDIFRRFEVSKNDSIIYVITSLASRPGNRIKFYRSTNLGQNWEVDSLQSLLQSAATNVMIVNPVDPSIIYLATGDYLTPFPGDILKSTDQGITWSKMNTGLPETNNRYLYALVINPSNPQTLYVGTYGWGVYKTINGGENWEWTNLTKAPIASIYIDEDDPKIIYACTMDEGVLKTTNGGLVWQPLNIDLPQTVQRPFFKITFDTNDDNLAYIASKYGVLKSTDGGNNWNITTLLGDFDHSVYEIVVHPKSSDTLFAGLVGWLDRKDLYRSTDKGDTWTNLRLTNGEEGVAKVLFNPVNSNIIYVAALTKGIFKTTDNGNTWRTQNIGLGLSDPPYVKAIASLEILRENPLILYSDNGGIVKTVNGGENWFRIDSTLIELESNIKVSRITQRDGRIYLSSNNFIMGNNTYYSDGALYQTTDEGLSWSNLGKFQIGSSGPGEVKISNNGEVLIPTMTGIYKGSDTITSVGGETLESMSIKLAQNHPNPFNSSTKISFQLRNTEYVSIRIYNILGEEVKILIEDYFNPGKYNFAWNGNNSIGDNVPSGIYFFVLKTGEYIETKKMIVLR